MDVFLINTPTDSYMGINKIELETFFLRNTAQTQTLTYTRIHSRVGDLMHLDCLIFLQAWSRIMCLEMLSKIFTT
jgi:hypothetical protein